MPLRDSKVWNRSSEVHGNDLDRWTCGKPAIVEALENWQGAILYTCTRMLAKALMLSFFINPIGASDQAWGAIATIRGLVPEP